MLRLASELDAAADTTVDPTSHAPRAWDDWLRELFPHLFRAPFAEHHVEFWDWVDTIRSDNWQPAFLSIWPRGGAKTTSAEAAVVRLGAKGARRFCLYVRSVQGRANESVRNIAAMLESTQVERYYPLLAQRRLSKYGFSQGWKADMLRCASGFSVVGLGFDAAIRGVKIEADRPDLIILDDIDEKFDTLATIEKKIRILTSSILPAGATNAVILGIQNLVHDTGVFARLVDGSAGFLHDRQISGPHPAIVDLTYTERPAGGYAITGGTATWAGQDLATCERQINEWGLTAFLQEAQHEVKVTGGIWDNVTFRHTDVVPDLVRGAVWIDPAVTSTDNSDCQAIQADGLGADNILYRLYSWEGITSPEEAVTRAVLKCLELGLDTVGIETDQGGDTWQSVYAQVWERVQEAAAMFVRLEDDEEDEEANNLIAQYPAALLLVAPLARDIFMHTKRLPAFKSAKAGAGHGSKVARNQRMLVSYEQGKVVHLIGTHTVLERSLQRFPNKPLDLVDAAYWGWYDLVDSLIHGGKVGRLRDRRPTQVEQLPQYLTLRYIGRRSFPLTIGKQPYMIEPGWHRSVDAVLARQIAAQFSENFEVVL